MRYWPRRAAVRATVLAYLSMLVWACTESTAPHEPSGRAPLIPSFASSTWWAEQNIIEVCRYFGPPGPALTWTGEGSSWAGACPVQPIATPSQTMGSANPGPVTFTFQEPVRRIGMRYLCEYSSQCTPVQFEAYDANNQLVASGTWVPDGPNYVGGEFVLVKRLVFLPPSPMPPDISTTPGSAISFAFDYYVPCPDTGDPVLNSLAVKTQLINELLLSRPNVDGSGKMERAGVIWRRSDGTFWLESWNDGLGRDCRHTPPPSPADIPRSHGDSLYGYFHTHATRPGERFLHPDCGGFRAGDRWKNGGGSPSDWDAANVYNRPQYTISIPRYSSQPYEVARLDPGVAYDDEAQQRANTAKWKFDRRQSCLIH